VGNVDKDEIYTKRIGNYGGVYRGYGDMNCGQIQYYIPSDNTADAYFEPNFVTPATIIESRFRDPMDVIRPEYHRHSHAYYNWDACARDQCDSYTHDTLEYRQYLMERQMRRRNEQRSEPILKKYIH
jgi:hypothetical protein